MSDAFDQGDLLSRHQAGETRPRGRQKIQPDNDADSDQDEAPPPPLLPVGSMEDLRAHLWRQHQTTVDPTDPILMVHTINQVALDNFEICLDERDKALTDQVRRIGGNLTSQIRGVVDEFKTDASAAAVRERVAAIQEATRLADTSQIAFRRSVRLLIGLTVVNLVAVVFTLGALTVLLR